MIRSRKKLIEVALPLEAINVASVRESYIYRGNPSALHKWWAQRPLAAARAVIFSQMVDDPSEYLNDLRSDPVLLRQAESRLRKRRKVWEEARRVYELPPGTGAAAPEPGPEPTLDEILAQQERERLFAIIEQLVLWENTTNEAVLQEARDEIWQSWRRACADNAGHPRAADLFDRNKLPAFHDPFAGGGTLPLEAQRLGLESHAGDLNPVAVFINKAMIEIPPKFAGASPVHPAALQDRPLVACGWRDTEGLAEDVRRYGQWIRDQAEERIGHLYPKVKITQSMATDRPDLLPHVGRLLTVAAWIWVRTVRSPNPAFADVLVPLSSTFVLAGKPGREVYVEPTIGEHTYRFAIRTGKPDEPGDIRNGTKLGRGASFRCLMSSVPITPDYVRAESLAGRLGVRLLAAVLDSGNGRLYVEPTDDMEQLAGSTVSPWRPTLAMPANPRWFSPPLFGLSTYGDLFTDRQLLALTTLSDLILDARQRVISDALAAGMSGHGAPLAGGGTGATAYGDAVSVYLACVFSRVLHYSSTVCTWLTKDSAIARTFTKQAIPMTWDFAEGNPFGKSSASWDKCVDVIAAAVRCLVGGSSPGLATVRDATSACPGSAKFVISTDPPYYDNIGYAELSDFFYVWLRRVLPALYPDLVTTVSVPKGGELIADPHRHGDRATAQAHFTNGMTDCIAHLLFETHPAYPVTVYYAFKQMEYDAESGATSTGWDTFLSSVIEAGFSITGTWPMRTEGDNRQVGIGTNALASSIVLVCRKRAADAPAITRRAFLTALKAELPPALATLQRGNIAPVDLAQAAIGPGMAVYTRYSSVLDAQGMPVTVREALALINEVLAESLAEQEGDFDADSRWALAWFEQCGFNEGEFGTADTLARAKNTSVQGLVEAGILVARQGKARLLRPAELPADWDPTRDNRLTAWEMVHHLVRVLEKEGETGAAELVGQIGARAEVARELCYRLYALCERAKRSAEAQAYNGLVQSWPEISRLAAGKQAAAPVQGTLDIGDGE